MTPDEWAGLGAGVTLALAIGTLARLALKGGALERPREYSFECPRFHEDVQCRVLQDIRTGQWQEVVSCSAFVEPDKILCERECARLSNLGLLRART